MDFTHLIDLAAARTGGRAAAANDEFFAPKSNLLKPAKAVWLEGKYTARGKWMDGWETRRRRTPGLRREPAPYVYQRALSDFYVEYQLNATLDEPRQRMSTLSALHANILDLFNEYGVQIMSPHYRQDSPEKVFVPKDRWFEAPAVRTGEAGSPGKKP